MSLQEKSCNEARIGQKKRPRPPVGRARNVGRYSLLNERTDQTHPVFGRDPSGRAVRRSGSRPAYVQIYMMQRLLLNEILCMVT